MPITPAHAAAAWPLRRPFRRLPLAALVIGTLSPDLEYLLRLDARGKFGHTPVGLVLFCIPATLLVWWGWRALVRPALVPLLPPGMRGYATPSRPPRRSDEVPLAIAAALLGALTHVLWDGFTHPGSWGVVFWPALNDPSPFGITWFYFAQYASSVFGVVVVAVWIAVCWRRVPRDARRFAPGQRARIARLVLLVVASMLACAAVNARLVHLPRYFWIGRAAVCAEIGFGLALVAYGLARRRRTRADSASGAVTSGAAGAFDGDLPPG